MPLLSLKQRFHRQTLHLRPHLLVGNGLAVARTGGQHVWQNGDVAGRSQEDARAAERPVDGRGDGLGSSSGLYHVARVWGACPHGAWTMDLIVSMATRRS